METAIHFNPTHRFGMTSLFTPYSVGKESKHGNTWTWREVSKPHLCFSNLYTIQVWCVQWKWKGSNGTPSLAVYKLQPSSAHVGRIRRLARARLWEVRAWSEVCFPRGCLSAAVAAVCVWLVRSHPNKELFRSWARLGQGVRAHTSLCALSKCCLKSPDWPTPNIVRPCSLWGMPQRTWPL